MLRLVLRKETLDRRHTVMLLALSILFLKISDMVISLEGETHTKAKGKSA